MAVKVSTLEKHLESLRRIEEHRTVQSERAIRRVFQELLKDLREFLGVEYSTLSEDDKLTYEILQRKGQYARFLEEVERRINYITPNVSSEIRQLVENVYTLCYEGMITAISKSNSSEEMKELLEGVSLNADIVKKAVENPISGLTLADTLERNRKEIIYNIKKQITVGLLNGDRMSSMARRIAGSVDNNYRKSIMIARTETHRVREAGFLDSSREINNTLDKGTTSLRMMKTWRTMKDERVRKTRKANHRKLDGVTIPIDDYFNLGRGVKAKAPSQSGDASNDINCRCYLSYDLKEV